MVKRTVRALDTRLAQTHPSLRSGALRLTLAALVGMLLVLATVIPPQAHADAVAYLIDATVRPGYGFADANDALDYGNRLCDKVVAGASYADLIANVKSDFNTGDEYQASYLIDRAVNELCPGQIWQLRTSAAHYRPLAY